MARLNEKVLASLIKRALEIEENNTNITMKLFMVEDNTERRKVFYEIIRDSEFHKSILTDWLEWLKGELPPESPVKDYSFEEMFIDQKLHTLKKIETMARDFYRYFLSDLNASDLERLIGKENGEELISTLKTLIQEKENHLKMVEQLQHMG
jgi:rubrerythrin